MRATVFTHTPRTGGSSLRVALSGAFGERVFLVNHAGEFNSLREGLIACRDTDFFVSGHFTLDDLQGATGHDPVQSLNLSSVRHPAERIASLMRFCHRYPAALGPIHDETRDRDLAYFAQHIHDKHPMHGANSMCYFLSGMPDFPAAQRALLLHYDVVGSNRRLADLVREIGHRLGLQLALPTTPINATRDAKAQSDDIPPPVRRLIERLNPADMELHSFVDETWDGLFMNATRQGT